jgi:hypothetical protein
MARPDTNTHLSSHAPRGVTRPTRGMGCPGGGLGRCRAVCGAMTCEILIGEPPATTAERLSPVCSPANALRLPRSRGTCAGDSGPRLRRTRAGLVCRSGGLRCVLNVNCEEHDNSSPVCWLERFPYQEDVIGSSPVHCNANTLQSSCACLQSAGPRKLQALRALVPIHTRACAGSESRRRRRSAVGRR